MSGITWTKTHQEGIELRKLCATRNKTGLEGIGGNDGSMYVTGRRFFSFVLLFSSIFSLSLSLVSLSSHSRTQVTLLLYCGNLACSMKGITLSATNTVIAHTSTKFLTVEWESYIGGGGKWEESIVKYFAECEYRRQPDAYLTIQLHAACSFTG